MTFKMGFGVVSVLGCEPPVSSEFGEAWMLLPYDISQRLLVYWLPQNWGIRAFDDKASGPYPVMTVGLRLPSFNPR